MSIQRRTFLGLGTAAALGAGGYMLGAGNALADPVATRQQQYGIGVRRYDWDRDGRPCTTYVYYPSTGDGGDPVEDAPVADGAFPVYNYTHGWGSDPQGSEFFIRPLAAAGFIVPAPHFEYGGAGDVYSGEPSKDVSEIITQTLALNEADDPLAGHIDETPGVGVSGHSLGGMTTHGLLSAWPDERITSANPQSCVEMGDPAASVSAKVVFVHGDRDDLTGYDSARDAYEALPAPKAFLTFVGGSHTSFWGDDRFPNTVVDWALWSLKDDTEAKDRLEDDAAGDDTRWEFVEE